MPAFAGLAVFQARRTACGDEQRHPLEHLGKLKAPAQTKLDTVVEKYAQHRTHS